MCEGWISNEILPSKGHSRNKWEASKKPGKDSQLVNSFRIPKKNMNN